MNRQPPALTPVRTRQLAVITLLAVGCARSGPQGASSTAIKVGPPKGSAIVVGGGSVGPEIMGKFIELAGGPDALIIDVPTAGGAAVYPEVTGTSAQIIANGAKHVVVLHTKDRKLADSDSFVAIIKKAGGVWFEGGRQNLLVDAYAGTKTETEFHNVLARGGVVAGSSAGASIQGSFLIRGASTVNTIMDAPGRNVGFGFLRGVGIDQHVVARERLPDLADSVMNKYPALLFISEDEGTAWVVRGDNAEIIGRNKAFVYNGKDRPDSGKPFLTLRPGDRYNLASRHVTHRAIEESNLTQSFVDSVLRTHVGSTPTQVLVAQGGKVFVNSSYNIPPQRRYMPTTTMPNFELRGISRALNGAAARWLVREGRMTLDEPLEDGGSVTVRQYLGGEADVADGDRKLVALFAKRSGGTYGRLAQQRVLGPPGTHKTEVDSAAGAFKSNVDELYRMELTIFRGSDAEDGNSAAASAGAPLGWSVDRYRNQARQSAFARLGGKRAAYVRFPDRRAAIIVLTDSDLVDARAIAERIAERMFVGTSGGGAP